MQISDCDCGQVQLPEEQRGVVPIVHSPNPDKVVQCPKEPLRSNSTSKLATALNIFQRTASKEDLNDHRKAEEEAPKSSPRIIDRVREKFSQHKLMEEEHDQDSKMRSPRMIKEKMTETYTEEDTSQRFSNYGNLEEDQVLKDHGLKRKKSFLQTLQVWKTN